MTSLNMYLNIHIFLLFLSFNEVYSLAARSTYVTSAAGSWRAVKSYSREMFQQLAENVSLYHKDRYVGNYEEAHLVTKECLYTSVCMNVRMHYRDFPPT